MEAGGLNLGGVAIHRGLQFRLYPLRFSFVARESIYFPPGKSANILRGAFGTIFRSIVCVPTCASARSCELRASCAYARMFEPAALERGPSGLADWPRPFVFRAMHLDGRTIEPGAAFSFDLNLFDLHNPAIAHLVFTFAQLAQEGLGPSRGRTELVDVLRIDENRDPVTRLYDGSSMTLREVEPMNLSLDPPDEAVRRVRVRFMTPAELKSGRQIVSRPEFGVLVARIRDRLSKLRELYDDGPLAIDFRAFGARAAQVRMTRCEMSRVEVDRRSSRTGQTHSIGGFTGEAEYEGDLSEFVPYLSAAKWTGVGRQTVWGKGQIEISRG